MSTPTSTPTPTLGGREVWTVRGTPADGSFLSGGDERSWGMADLETHDGVVVEDAGVPGSEGEADGPNGLQVW
jgi:transcription factor C subunit 7